MDGDSSGGGGGEERPKKMSKKGMWTLQEDEILTEYVRRHGEGNWNAVRRHTPLLRSGKSCRLRWANHLRPDLKKGAFSPEEESLVVQLHAEYGNRWAHMASLMPGRTDNEIKNFWNTRTKRIRRAYLPIYPRRFRRAQSNESSPSNPRLTVGNAQPPPPFFGPSSSQWNWPGPGQCQRHQLPPQSTIAGIRHHLSAFCSESHLPSRGASVVLPSIQITPLGAMVPSFGGACGFFPMRSKESMSGLFGDVLLGESETLAQKEMEKKNREGLGSGGAEAVASSSFRGEPIEERTDEIEWKDDGLLGCLLAESETLALKDTEKYLSEGLSSYRAEVAYQAASSSFSEHTQFSGREPTEEPIDEVECMDDGLLGNLLAEFETLVPKEMEKNHSESLNGYCADTAYQATSTSFDEYIQFFGGQPTEEPIDEIDCVDNGLLGNLLAEFENLVPKETEKNHSGSLSGYRVEAAYQATSSSFNECTQFSGGQTTEEAIDEIDRVDDGLLGTLLAESETLTLKEMKKNKSESSSGYHAKVADQATSSSFSEHTLFSGAEPTEEPMAEIESMGEGLLGDLLAECETLVPKEMEKNKSESLSGYRAEVADQASSSSFRESIEFSGGEPTEEPMDKIQCMDDDLSGLLSGFISTMPSPDW